VNSTYIIYAYFVYSVVCHQLGFGDAFRAYTHEPTVDTFALPIWLNGVHCTDETLYLDQCGHTGVGNVGDCSHYEDAGVECSGITGIQLSE